MLLPLFVIVEFWAFGLLPRWLMLLPLYLIVYVLGSNFLYNRIYFQKTQAFANPTDLASSGVWENVFPTKTSGFDGV